MDELQIKAALQELGQTLEGKNKTEIATSINSLEVKIRDAYSAEITNEKANFDAELLAVKAALLLDIKEVQDYADGLDVKLQAKTHIEGETRDEIRFAIKENFDEIKTVRKGHGLKLDLKVVGNMTLPVNLTGDQPRIYRDGIVALPKDPVNFADLVGNVNIDGGTYTFPQETGGEGAPAIQTEGSDKAQMDYYIAMIDCNTDFLAGFVVYSKKMANNLPFLESFLPQAMRRDYFKAENGVFYAEMIAEATATTTIVGNHVERIIADQMILLGLGYQPNIVVVNPADYGAILVTAGTDGTGAYSLPGVVTIINGVVNLNGLAVIPASWVAADKYIIGDWSYSHKVTTQGLGVEFFEQDSDNVRKNNITARVEAQVCLAVLQGAAFIYGDFVAIA
jgi:HK97 family phage major capsid protein